MFRRTVTGRGENRRRSWQALHCSRVAGLILHSSDLAEKGKKEAAMLGLLGITRRRKQERETGDGF